MVSPAFCAFPFPFLALAPFLFVFGAVELMLTLVAVVRILSPSSIRTSIIERFSAVMLDCVDIREAFEGRPFFARAGFRDCVRLKKAHSGERR